MEILVSAVVGLISIEVYAWLPMTAKWLLAVAIRRVPEANRVRCSEEWNAALEALPNTLIRLWHASSFLFAANAIREDALESESRARIGELVAAQAASSERVLTLRRKIDRLPTVHRELRSSLGGQKVRLLDAAWAKTKEQFEAHAAANDRVTAAIEKASASLVGEVEARRKPLLFWRQKVYAERAHKNMMEAHAALSDLVSNKNLDNALGEYGGLVDQLYQVVTDHIASLPTTK